MLYPFLLKFQTFSGNAKFGFALPAHSTLATLVRFKVIAFERRAVIKE